MLFQNVLFSEEFLGYIGYILGYLPKLNRSLELVSGAEFQQIFLWKVSSYDTLAMDQVSILDLLYIWGIKQFSVLKS